MKVAIFDFDGTIYPEETFPLMMKYLKTHPLYSKRYRYFFRKILPIFLAYKLKLYPEAKMKSMAMHLYVSSFGSTPKSEVEQFFMQLGNQMSGNLSEPLVDRLKQHCNDGYYTMVVSGAFEPLLHSAFKNLHLDCIIGTNIPVDKHQAFDHINGKRKIAKIYEQLKNKHVDWQNSYAYGDSYSDLDMLELVGNPVAVNPDQRLSQMAMDRKWEVIG